MIRLILILAVLVGLAVLAQATGLISVNTSGMIRAPSVDVKLSGGEAPKLQVETAKVRVGVTERTVELPKVDVGMEDRSVDLPTVEVSKAAKDASDERSTTR